MAAQTPRAALLILGYNRLSLRIVELSLRFKVIQVAHREVDEDADYCENIGNVVDQEIFGCFLPNGFPLAQNKWQLLLVSLSQCQPIA